MAEALNRRPCRSVPTPRWADGWPWRMHAAAAALVALSIHAGVASAQVLPGLPKAVAPSSSAGAASSNAGPVGAPNWSDRLAEARAAHERLLADPDVPAGADRRRASSRLIALLAARADHAAQAPSGAASAPAAAPTAVTLRGDPPYPVPEVDALRDQHDSLLAEHAALTLTLRSLDSEVDSALQARRKAAEVLRLRQEQFERGRSSADAAALEGQFELARLQARVAELELGQADEARTATRDRQAGLSKPIEALEREIERVRSQQRLDDDDLRPLRDTIATEIQRLQAERARAARELARGEVRLKDGGQAAILELRALRGRVQTLDELEAIERGKVAVWAHRQEVTEAGADRELQRAAAALLGQAMDQVQARQRAAAEQLALLRSEYRVQQSRLASMKEADPEAAGEQQALSALGQQIAVHERIQEQLVRIGTLLARSRLDLRLADVADGTRGWLERTVAAARTLIRQAWEYELFNATETSAVDGRVVNVDYGVTVGKSVAVLALFLLGYVVVRRLALRVTDLLVARAYLSPQLGQVLRRWVTSVLLLVVLLIVFRLARVPLAAFAFLGGALAIGVGFGAQNIIKNLISGVIILFERKVRVGDVVTIGGISGTVTAVDLRATTVRGFDGIESIVPNSNLLETQVSNWSSGSPTVRRAIAVGVVYGSDTRRTSDLILACAQRQPATLSDPAPEVVLDEFGSDALVFRLLYWMRLGGTRSGMTVDSDIRYEIERDLRGAGIVMAFPQRDIHLDSAAPLRVELSRAPPAPSPQDA